LQAECVVAQAANQLNGITEPRNGHRLICAFAARMNVKVIPDDRLADRRNPLGT
jgi:hypothetical protein